MIEEEVTAAIHWIYESYGRVADHIRGGYDRDVRHPIWTRWLLDQLGAPDQNQYNVAVTGSKGKGAHAILLAAILQRLGMRVGLFTSPHLVDFLERIRVDGYPIAGQQFVDDAERVKSITRRAQLPPDHYFGSVGLLAVMASLCFDAAATDVNVFELGRGARHDDVNQVAHRGAVCTPVFAEHLDKLGPTWTDVMKEKLGVVTAQTKWLVSYEQAPTVIDTWGQSGELTDVQFAMLGRDFAYTLLPDEGSHWWIQVQASGLIHQARVADTMRPFAGNVAVALVAAARVLADFGKPTAGIDVDLSTLCLPGRLQVVRREPTCVVDGTVHALGAQMLVKWLKDRTPTGDVHVVLSLPDDKDASVIETLAPYCTSLCLTTSSNRHLAYSRDLGAVARRYIPQVDTQPDVDLAIGQALERAQASDTVLFVGTQSYVGDVLRYFAVPTQSIWQLSGVL